MLAAVVLLAAQAALGAAEPKECVQSIYGTIAENFVDLDEQTLYPGYREYDVTLPQGVCGETQHQQHVGTQLGVCDDEPASVFMFTLYDGHITRHGDYARAEGVVYARYYCT